MSFPYPKQTSSARRYPSQAPSPGGSPRQPSVTRPFDRLSRPRVPVSASSASAYPDAISTSSSTLVNLDSDPDVRPWELGLESSDSHSSSSSSSSSSASPSLQGSLRAGSEGGTEGTETQRIHRFRPSISSASVATADGFGPGHKSSPRRPAYVEIGDHSQPGRSDPSPPSRTRQRASLSRSGLFNNCPDDCRCSDQDIQLGLCRRALLSSSSASDDDKPPRGYTPTKPGQLPPLEAKTSISGQPRSPRRMHHLYSRNMDQRRPDRIDRLKEWSGRDLLRDPVLVPKPSPKKSPSKTRATRSSDLSISRSGGQARSERSQDLAFDSESDAEQNLSSRSQLLARWARRPERGSNPKDPPTRQDIDRTFSDEPVTFREEANPSFARSSSSPIRPPLGLSVGRSNSLVLDSTTPLHRRETDAARSTPQSAPPASNKHLPDRRSIAAVFEKMQMERVHRLEEEKRLREEKRLHRERERAARALGWQSRRSSHPNEDRLRSSLQADRQEEEKGQATSTANMSGFLDEQDGRESSPAAADTLPSAFSPPVDGETGNVEALSNASDENGSARARALARVRSARLKRLSAGGASSTLGTSITSPNSSTGRGAPRRAIEDSSSDSSDPNDGEDSVDSRRPSHQAEVEVESTKERSPVLDASHIQEGQGTYAVQVGGWDGKDARLEMSRDGEGAAGEESIDGTEDLREALDRVMSQSSRESSLAIVPDPGVHSDGTSPKTHDAAAQPHLQLPIGTPQLSEGFSFPASRSPSDASTVASSQASSAYSSPASSPRNPAHRRQRTSVVSLSANVPAGSAAAAARAINRILRANSDEVDACLQQAAPSPGEADDGRTTVGGRGRTEPEQPVDSSDELSATASHNVRLDAERRRRSVRFSPQPDYRSDSGSGRESHEGEDKQDDGSPDEASLMDGHRNLRVVNRHPLDAPPSPDPSNDEQEQQQVTLAPIERALQLENEMHTRLRDRRLSSAASPNRSISMHLPGGYVATPSRVVPASASRPARSLPEEPYSEQVPRLESAREPLHDHLRSSTLHSSRVRATSPPLPSTASPSSTLPPSPSSRGMSPAQRQRLAAARAGSRSASLSSPPSFHAPSSLVEEDPGEQGDSADSVDGSTSLQATSRPMSDYMHTAGPRESTPPRNLPADRSRLSMSGAARPTDQRAKSSPLRRDIPPPTLGLFAEEVVEVLEEVDKEEEAEGTRPDEDDSVRITMNQILTALKRKEQVEAAHDEQAGQDPGRTAVRVQEVVRETIANLQAPISDGLNEAELVERAKALQLEAKPEADASLVGKIDSLRSRLAFLVSSLGSRLSRSSENAGQGPNGIQIVKQVVELRPPFYHNRRLLFFGVLFHLAALWLMLQAAQARYEYLYYTSYHDPFYPDLYSSIGTAASPFVADLPFSIPFLRDPKPHWTAMDSLGADGHLVRRGETAGSLASAATITIEVLGTVARHSLALCISLFLLPVQAVHFVLSAQTARLGVDDAALFLTPT